MVEKIKEEKGKITYGSYTKKQERTIKSSIIVEAILLVLFCGLGIILESFLLILVGVIVSLLIPIIITVKNDTLGKILREFYNTLDYETCEQKFIELYKQPLHSESRKVLMMNQVDLLLLIDIERASGIFDLIEMPVLKRNICTYQLLKFIIKYNKNDVENFYEDIAIFEKEYEKIINKRIINNIKQDYQICHTQNVIEGIEDKFSKYNSKFMELLSYFKLMQYYDVRNNQIKAKEYAKKVLDFNTNFERLNSQASEILNK